ncbi:MAG: ribosome small subunit-dependent GTPase A [Clostridiales Family XIII bacterium]|nr:ribosome small subunit-dependent GTPase A [Clostridiales Family XIII bacterium]
MYANLAQYGFGEPFIQEAAIYDGLFPARVTQQHRDLYTVVSESGEFGAAISGKLRMGADGGDGFPAVGDFVMLDRTGGDGGNAVIHHVLPRKSVFVRKAAGTAHDVQVVAANIDTIFICMSLNADFNLRRLERYLAVAWDSGATPVIVLTKSDLCGEVADRLAEVNTVAMGAEIIVCSSENGDGIDSIGAFVHFGKTIAFIGSSGVGKSTLINKLIGQDVLITKDIRAGDGKGRHTTTSRQLILLPGSGIVIDTPGMRELALASGDVEQTFSDIEALALECKYSDCTHTAEPGCAVQQAINNGTLSGKRFENYQKLQRELSYEGLNSRQLENEKINRMFGSKAEMKQAFRQIKNNKKR